MTSIALLLALQTAAPANRQCNRDATTTTAAPPDYPEAARAAGLGPTMVSVRVYLSPKGTISELRVANSSGNVYLDQAAIRAAAQSTFSPRIKNCKPTFGLYLYKVTFNPNR